MEPKKYDYIDAMRGIAIMLVILVHCGMLGQQMNFFPELLKQFVQNGSCGVQVFLLVSAYTLMHSQKSRKEEKNQTRRFYLRRFFRVAPMYYVGIIYFTLQNTVGLNHMLDVHAWMHFDSVGILSNLFFVHGFHPYTINYYVPGGWSIAVEMTFYLFFPLIFKFITSFNKALTFLFIALLIQKILVIGLSNNTFFLQNYFLSLWFPSQLPIFALGILIYFVLNEVAIKFTKLNNVLSILFMFAFIYLSVSTALAYAIVFGVLLMYFHKYGLNRFAGFFLTKIGKISYSMYLVHFGIIYWLEQFTFTDFLFVSDNKSAIANFIVRYIIIFIISALISFVTYIYIEKPFQQIGKKIILKYF